MDYKILIADDEPEIRNLLRLYLENENYHVIEAEDGQRALDLLRAEQPALCILDIMMPKMDGYHVLQQIRKESNIPVIILSAKDADSEKILGLNLGADDYLAKPFSYAELVSRAKALLRRYQVYQGKPTVLTQTSTITYAQLILKEQTQELCTNIDNSIGWINVPETKINYPVMYSGDNDFYLHRAVDGSYLRVGSIFLDYRCNSDFTSRINILYGHNMSDGSMFANVIKFIDSSYFDSHNYGWLSTPNAVYKIDFFSVSQPENYDDFYDVNSDVNLWLDDLRANSFIWRNIGISENDQFISLSTCTDSEGSSRTVLTGKLCKI